MSFQPVIPFGGYSGWRFLDQTLPAQKQAFTDSAPVTRATDYFAANIGAVRTADDLLGDRQLLTVALGAYGLDDDLNNTAFLRRILTDGTLSEDALANRLADSRYAEFSRAFGFGDPGLPGTQTPGFAADIIARYEAQSFSQAVGAQDNTMRLALNVETGLGDILDRNSTNTGRWFSIMGNPPLREVFQTALGLPDSISGIDVDRQREIFETRAASVLGTDDVAALADPAEQEKLIRLFMVRAQAAEIGLLSGASTALSLLQATTR